MREDEKTADGRHGPDSGKALIVRTTAPAGTPARRSPVASQDGSLPAWDGQGSSSMPALPSPVPSVHGGPGRFQSDRPIDTMTPARTVGGHTARLNVPEGVAAPPIMPEDRAPAAGAEAAPATHRSPPPGAVTPSIPVEMPPASSRTVGGTMRMAAVDPAEAEAAAKALAAAPAKVGSPASPPEGEATLGELLLAPVSVAVGLVFFAMGSIGTLTVEARSGVPAAVGPATSASTSSAPVAPPTARATASSSPTPSTPSTTALPPPVVQTTVPVASVTVPAATTPTPSARPGAGVRVPGTSRPGGRPRGGVFEPKGD